MSFGFGVSDFVTLSTLAWEIYKLCNDSPESFKNISQEVLALQAVLKQVDEILEDHPPSQLEGRRLATILIGCHDVLNDLQSLVLKNKSLGLKASRTLDRLRWYSAPIAELRARLTSNITLLNAYLRQG
jgi:hypothetical protein